VRVRHADFKHGHQVAEEYILEVLHCCHLPLLCVDPKSGTVPHTGRERECFLNMYEDGFLIGMESIFSCTERPETYYGNILSQRTYPK
jgi:hypothetical protein